MNGRQHQFYIRTPALQFASRRSHRKSRAGCSSCKSGHYKCSEERPVCRRCHRKGKVCNYPTTAYSQSTDKHIMPANHTISISAPSRGIGNCSASFTLLELKLFHHFLCFAHPPLPLHSGVVWKEDIPQLSHHSEPLMSALLALAATHMTTSDDGQRYLYTALSYQGRALAGLLEYCSRERHSSTDYDIMLAICYALMFQAALMPGKSTDFVAHIRGCASITEQIHDGQIRSIFRRVPQPRDTEAAPSFPSDTPDSDSYPRESNLPVLLSKGVFSLLSCRAGMRDTYRETTLLDSIRLIMLGYEVSPATGFNRFMTYYALWYKVATDKDIFSGISTEPEAQLLWAFFIALQLFTTLVVIEVCSPTIPEQSQPRRDLPSAAPMIQGLVEWLCALKEVAPATSRSQFAWSRLMMDEIMSRTGMKPVEEANIQSKVQKLGDFSNQAHIVLGDLLKVSAGLANWTADHLSPGNTECGELRDALRWPKVNRSIEKF